MTEDRDAVVCSSCGTPGPDDESALFEWSRGTDRGRTTWTCPTCARENVRAIEAKLDADWW